MADLELVCGLRVGALSLEVELRTDATRVAVLGPSGAGKTTLLRVLAGLERRGSARVAFRGQTWQDGATHVPPWQRRVGWVPQDAMLFPHLSVAENLGYAAPDASRVRAMAEWLGVLPLLDRAPRNLSGGERQRVALGRALLSSPRLLLLDEPFSALDKPLRARLLEALDAWCRDHDLPVVLVSHEAADVAALEAEPWVIAAGRIEREARVDRRPT